MIADFIGGPWHLQTRQVACEIGPLVNSAGDRMELAPNFVTVAHDGMCSYVPVRPDAQYWAPYTEYKLTIQTPTFCVYVDTSQALPWKHTKADLYDPVRYFFAREHRFAEEVKGWTHHNAEFAAASAEGLRGMLAIQRFRKRR